MGRKRSRKQFDLWQHPNGVWYVVWTTSQGTDRKSTGKRTRSEAEKWRDQFVAGIATPAAPETPTIAAIIEGYLADRKPKVRSYATLDFSCRPLGEHLGNLEPAHLSNSVIQKYATSRHKEGRADGTIIRELVTLRAALKWAKGEKWLTEVPTFPMPVQSPPARDRWLTKDEARRLVEAAQALHVKLFIMLGLKTAARNGAIIDLTWNRIDFERRLIDYGPGYGNKNRSVVPIDDALLGALKTAKEIACTDYVIEFNGARVKSVRTGFEAACERAGLKEVGRHTLRHTAATWAVMEGVPLPEVARLLGDSEKMVEKVYGKHTPDYLRRAIQSLDF